MIRRTGRTELIGLAIVVGPCGIGAQAGYSSWNEGA